MELHEYNIEEWKQELDRLAIAAIDHDELLSTTCTNEEWLKDYTGYEPSSVVDEMVHYLCN